MTTDHPFPSLPWPSDEEVDANPEFWQSFMMAWFVAQPEGHIATTEDLAHYFEAMADGKAPPLTPLMCRWLAEFLKQFPSIEHPRGREMDSRNARHPDTEIEIAIARRVAERMTGRRVQSDERCTIIAEEIKTEIASGNATEAWLTDQIRLRNIETRLKNRARLLQPR